MRKRGISLDWHGPIPGFFLRLKLYWDKVIVDDAGPIVQQPLQDSSINLVVDKQQIEP